MDKYVDNYLKQLPKLSNKPLFKDKQPSCLTRQNLIIEILNALNNMNPDSIIESYLGNIKTKTFNKQDYFKILIETVNCYGQNNTKTSMVKEILQKLLQIQNNDNKYLNLVPKELFLSLKRFNPLTYQRKQKKISALNESTFQKKTMLQQETKGYAEVTLNLSIYFRETTLGIDIVWNKIINIAGKFSLNFNKITQIVLQLLPTVSSQEKIVQIAKILDKDSLLYHLAIKLFPNIQEGVVLKYFGPITDLIFKSTSDLHLQLKSSFNPAYSNILKVLISNNIITYRQLDNFSCSCTPNFIINRQKQIMQEVNIKVEKSYNRSLQTFSLSDLQLQKSKQNLILMGQITGCFKFAMMEEYLRGNNFKQFKSIYQILSCQSKIDLSLSASLIRTFCHLIQWIIDPLLEKYTVRRFFENKVPKNGESFNEGYFKQSSEISIQVMLQLEEIFQYLDIYIGFSSKTFEKLCKVFAYFLKRQTGFEDIDQFGNIVNKIKQIIQKFLIGALSLQSNNCSMTWKLYDLLKVFQQTQRFQLYFYFFKNIMFQKLHLVHRLQKIGKSQGKLMNKISNQTYPTISKQLIKYQSNYLFQSLFEMVKKVSAMYSPFLIFYLKIISKGTSLSADLMLFLCLDSIVKNQDKLMNQYDFVDDNYQAKISFICKLYSSNSEISMEVILNLALTRLKQKIDEPLATNEIVPKYNRNFVFIKILSYLMQESCPTAFETLTSAEDNYEHFLDGYFMRLQRMDKMIQFGKNNDLRRIFVTHLCKKDGQGKSYFLSFTQLMNFHLNQLCLYQRNHQQNATITLQKHSKAIDQCTLLINHMIKIVSTELNIMKNQHQNSQQLIPISFEQICSLVIENNLNLTFASFLLLQLKKINSNQYKFSELKKKWATLVTQKYKLRPKLRDYSLFIDDKKLEPLIKSNLFYYFWFSNISHLIFNQTIYCNKITQLRRKLQGAQYKSKFGKNKFLQTFTEDQQEKYRCLIGYNTILAQKQQLRSAFNQFNGTNYGIQSQQTSEKNIKIEIPSQYIYVKEKIKHENENNSSQIAFKQFTNLFFSSCILPRMLIDPCQAMYCAKFVFRIIQQNKLPSNKSLVLILTLLEAAISYVPFSTQRQASKCIPVFVNELLKIFRKWDNPEELSSVLLQQICMQRFTPKRYDLLKTFLFDFVTRITNILISVKKDPFVNRNLLFFIDQTHPLPLTRQQGQQFLLYFREVSRFYQNQKQYENVKLVADRMCSVMDKRKSKVSSIRTVILNKSIKQDINRIKKPIEPSKIVVIDLDLDSPVAQKQKPKKIQHPTPAKSKNSSKGSIDY